MQYLFAAYTHIHKSTFTQTTIPISDMWKQMPNSSLTANKKKEESTVWTNSSCECSMSAGMHDGYAYTWFEYIGQTA